MGHFSTSAALKQQHSRHLSRIAEVKLIPAALSAMSLYFEGFGQFSSIAATLVPISSFISI